MSSKNTSVREYAFQFLYHRHFLVPTHTKNKAETLKALQNLQEDELLEFEETYLNADSELKSLNLSLKQKNQAHSLIRGTLNHYLEISNLIDKFSKGWKQEKMNKVDLAIIYLGVYELKFQTSMPEKVILNDMINLAKKFGTETSYSFVNGLLDEIRKS